MHLRLHHLLQHVPAKLLKCKIGAVSQLQQIGLQLIAVEATTATAEMEYSIFKLVPAWVKDGHREGIKVHLLLVQEEQIEPVVRRMCLADRET